jgi:ubiquinone/menaquinone biosynthesis C-methylase UbiE
MNEATDMQMYYARRAAEYERFYAKPERQQDLPKLIALVAGCLAGRRVLEIACGTGWWTERYAPHASSVYATDVNEEVLAIARAKSYPADRVRFAIADAFDLQAIPGEFDAVFAGFWWSHLKRAQLAGFLDAVSRRLGGSGSGSRVVFLDNRYVEGSSTPIAETDAAGDAWQLRKLDDGSTHRVLKNFPDAKELKAAAQPFARKVEVTELPYFWLLDYEL